MLRNHIFHPHMTPRFFLKPLLLAFGLFLALLVPCLAQEPEGKTAIARFTVWGDWNGKELYIKKPGSSSKKDEDFIKLDLLNLGYSAAVPFHQAKPFELCTPLEKDGETIWQPLITVTIPAGIREPLVMIFPEGSAGPRFRVFELHPSVFPYGDYQLVNLSKVPLYAKLDETVLNLPQDGSGQFKGVGKTNMNVWLRVAAEDLEKKSHIVYSSMMRNRGDKRMFMFFHPRDTSADTMLESPVSVKTLVDFAPQKPE